MSIRITTLGTVQVVRGDRTLAALPSQRLRCALLIYMAVCRRSTRDRLVSVFWPERSDERARHALSQNIYELRRALGEDWIEIRGEQYVVAPHVSVDLPAFEESVEKGDYALALGLYRGAFLDGFYLSGTQAFETWVDGVRQRVQRQHRKARREWIKQLVDQARMRDALAAARDWVALDSGDDEAQHKLIELLAEAGDRAGAIRQYELYERLLAADELRPLDDTQALVERIRGGDVGALPATSPMLGSARPPRPAAASPREPAPPAPAVDEQPTTASARALPRLERQRAIAIAAIAVFVVAVSLVSAKMWRQNSAPAPPATRHIAVLYFDDRSPPPGVGHLANGFTETLIDELTGLDPLLVVRSKDAVRPFRDRAVSPDSLAAALDVDFLITGRVVSADGQVRVSYQLVDAATGTQLDRRQVQRADGQYLELLDDLVGSVAVSLRQRIGARLSDELFRARAPSSEALAMLLQALETGERGLRLLEDDEPDGALAEYARADSLLADAERQNGSWVQPVLERGWLAERRAFLELARRDTVRARAWLDSMVLHAERALAREPGSAVALELRGSALYRTATFASQDQGEISELLARAEQDLEQATRSDPSRARAFATLGSIYFTLARFEQALNAASRAHQLDAFLTQQMDNIYNIAMSEFELGHETEAADWCRVGRSRSRDSRFAYCILSVMAWSENLPAVPDSAWAVIGPPRNSTGGTPTLRPMMEMLVAGTLVRAGLPDSARAVLDRAAAKPSSSAATPWIEAAVRARLGEVDRAAQLLRQTFREGAVLGLPVRNGRALRPLLTNPTILNAMERRPSR